jgi:hypothetical protein
MRIRSTRAAVAAVSYTAVAALAALPTVACQPHPRPDDRPPGSSSAASAGPDAAFLAKGECSTRGRAHFQEVSCGSERAFAKVAARFEGRKADGPRCPAYTDFVLHITERLPGADENGDGSVPAGHACMRHLEPPHPGDPGGGGGPRTVVGDCVHTSKQGEVRETACDGSGRYAPEFRITARVASRAECPPSTSLFVRLGGTAPVGCARDIR